MNSRITQKLLIVGLIISICFIAACGKSTVSSSVGESTEDFLQGNKTCYMGPKSTCADLKAVNAKAEGYNNPNTDSSFPSNAKKDQYRMPIQGIDMNKVAKDMQIAPNFKLIEFMSAEKGSFGIFSPAVLKIIQKLRDKIGGSLTINSGFRPPKWNEGIDGSAKWSRHQYGDGVDIVSSKASLDQLVKYCRDLGATYVDKYVAHVHCDWRNLALEPAFFGSTTAKISTLSTEADMMLITQDVSDASQIIITGDLKVGNIVRLSSKTELKEDEEELYKSWVVVLPDGSQAQFEQSEVSLPLQQHGTYQVVHTIGANVELRTSFFVN